MKKKAAKKKSVRVPVETLETRVVALEGLRRAANEAKRQYDAFRKVVLAEMLDEKIDTLKAEGTIGRDKVSVVATVNEKTQTQLNKSKLIKLIGQEAFNEIATTTKTAVVSKHGSATWARVSVTNPTGDYDVTVKSL